MSKILYVVRGNHDGNIGVFSTLAKAGRRAVAYVTDSNPDCKPTLNFRIGDSEDSHGRVRFDRRVANPANIKKAFESGGHVCIEADPESILGTEASIEAFSLNR